MLELLTSDESQLADRNLSADEITEIISVASAISSEAAALAQNAQEILPQDDWILNALALSGEDELFNVAFVNLCAKNSQNFGKLYRYSCQFIYRSMIRSSVKKGNEVDLKSFLRASVEDQTTERIFQALRKSGMLADKV
jgi:hypothetical protein